MERNTSGTGEGIRVALALLLACALLMLPLWWQGGSQGHDLFHHLLSGHYFARQLWQGELYPRWLMAMNGGFGSPTFFFYPPLPYYVSALFAGPGAPPSRPSTLCLAAPHWPCCSPGCLPICGCVPPRPLAGP